MTKNLFGSPQEGLFGRQDWCYSNKVRVYHKRNVTSVTIRLDCHRYIQDFKQKPRLQVIHRWFMYLLTVITVHCILFATDKYNQIESGSTS